MLVCGNIQDIQSVFLTSKAVENDEYEDLLREKEKRVEVNIPNKYLVPLKVISRISIKRIIKIQDAPLT